jgi:A/G-specific adenine glycosylase
MAGLLPTKDLPRFRRALLDWFSVHQRDLPWRRRRDPYAIWISEIMLQQTRVVAVIPYYERFLARFPDFGTLAQAPENELLAYWSGLGYYYRARNLQKAAQTVCEAGEFPHEYAAIRKLPGIGDYTAAAISSISFDLPHAVVDGNVLRVLSRICADPTNIASVSGKQYFSALAGTLLDEAHPGAFNQAVMELGAVVCLPKNPHCLVCPVSDWCRARQAGTQADFPVKIVPRRSVRQKRTLFWVQQENRILAWQRPPTSRLMPGFWELPESEQLPNATPLHQLGSFRHGITFHNYVFELWAATVAELSNSCAWVDLADVERLPVSTVLKKGVRLAITAQQRKATSRSAAASST